MGNRPKMSLKYAIFKICPKLARKWYSCETRVYSTIFGDSWRQKVVSVFGFGHPKYHFLHPKSLKMAVFGCKKIIIDNLVQFEEDFNSRTEMWSDCWKWPENGHFQWFWVQKNGTWDAQIQKRRPLFVANYPQKWWNRLLFHKNIIFGRVLGKFWKSRILGSFLAYFPL